MSGDHWARLCLGLLVVPIIMSTLTTPALAGPWVKSPGEAYLKLAGSAFRGTSLWDVDANQLDAPFVYSNEALTFQAEIGIFRDVALGITLPIIRGRNVVEERTTFERWGVGDLDVSAQYQLFRVGNCVGAAIMMARFPLYDGVISDGAGPGTVGTAGPERFLPALGDGSIDLNPTASAGCSLYPLPMWVSAEAGPNFRLRGFGQGLRYAADIGIWALPEILAFSARIDGVQRFTSDNERPTKNMIAVSGSATWRIWSGLGLEFTGGGIPWGAFVARGWQAGAGLSYSGPLIPGN